MGKFLKNIGLGLFIYHNYKILITIFLCVISFFAVEIIFTKWNNYDFKILYDAKFFMLSLYTLIQSLLLVGFVKLINSFKFKKEPKKERLLIKDNVKSFFMRNNK